MYRSFILSFFVFLLFGCSNQQNKLSDERKKEEDAYQLMEQKLKLNKKNYSIQIGENVKIYYTENSCCPICHPRLNKLASSKFLGSKTEIARDCIGCDFLYSINFKGVKKGIDTIFAQTISPHETCDSIADLKNFDIHIIRVN